MNYYVLKTQDNKELSVKEEMLTVFKNKFEIIMPFAKHIATLDGIKLSFFSRMLPNYLIIGAEKLSKQDIELISKIFNTDGFLYSSTKNGGELSVLEPDEVSQYLDSVYDFTLIDTTLEGELYILNGRYAGKTCKTKYKKLDYYGVIVNTRKTPEVRIPIWCLGKALKG